MHECAVSRNEQGMAVGLRSYATRATMSEIDSGRFVVRCAAPDQPARACLLGHAMRCQGHAWCSDTTILSTNILSVYLHIYLYAMEQVCAGT